MNTHAHTLIRHRDIQEWVSARSGQPAIRRVPDKTGDIRASLTLNFSHPRAPVEMPTQDDGMSPVSWSAWLAELDRQQLALRVFDQKPTAFELVERHRTH